MSFLSDLFGGGSKTSTSTQTTTQPGYIVSGSQNLLSRGTELANRPVTEYTGELTAGLTPEQMTAIDNIRRIVANQPNLTNTAISGAMGYANAPAQSVSYADTNKINADTAALMNPNVSASLQPVLDQIQKSYDAAQKATGARATMAGAFGDARQGIEESNNLFNKATAQGNATAQAYNTAYQQAQQGAQNLAQGKYGSDVQNANLIEQALQRLLTGSQTALTSAGAGTQQQLGANQALQASATQGQTTQQAADTAAYQEFLRQQGWDYNTIQALQSALTAQPNQSTNTTIGSAPNNAGSQLLGSAAGYLGSNLLGPSLSAAGSSIAASLAPMLAAI